MRDADSNLPVAWYRTDLTSFGLFSSDSCRPARSADERETRLSRLESHHSHSVWLNWGPMGTYLLGKDPCRRRGTLVRDEFFGASVCPPSGIPFRINKAGRALVKAVRDSGVKASDIDAYLMETYPDAACEVRAFVEDCVRLGWSDAPLNWARMGATPPWSRDFLAAPDTVYLYPSLHCNVRAMCTKCYLNLSGADYAHSELPPECIDQLLGEMSDAGVFHLIVLGGEPLLYAHLFTLLEKAADYPFITGMSTNGLLVDEVTADRLAVHLDRVQVSLDGPEASISEALKGPGTHDETVRSIQRLVARRLSVSVSYVLTPSNCDVATVRAFVTQMADLGVRQVLMLQYYPAGDCADAQTSITLAANDLVKQELDSLRERYTTMVITHEVPFQFLSDPSAHGLAADRAQVDPAHFGCECGRLRVSIYPNGDVYPCDFVAGNLNFRAGNVLNQPLAEIWRTSPVLDRFRRRSSSRSATCRGCEQVAICTGGCQSLAYLTFGSMDEPDPRCPMLAKMSLPMIQAL